MKIPFVYLSFNTLQKLFAVGLYSQQMKKKSLKIAAGLGLAQLAIFGSVATAQDTTRTAIKTNSLEQVVVTATRSPKRKAEIGKVVRIITTEQIERSQGR